MAVAFRHLARTGFRPKGTLIYYGVADEEAGGRWGAEWMVRDHWEALRSDYVLTEAGGWSSLDPHGTRHVVVNVGEKGIAWRRLRVRGRPSHGSMPFGADSALVKAAEVVRRLAEYRPEAGIDETWRAQVAVMNAPAELKESLLDPRRVFEALGTLPPAVAAMCHASTHTTFSPNVVHGGQKTNIIPDVVEIEVDIRTLPGTTAADVDEHLRRALGTLAEHVDVSVIHQVDPSASPTRNPLWDALAAHAQVAYPGSRLLPGILVGGTDARFFREKGAVAYGAGLFSPSMTLKSFGLRFHGNDERIDVESLGLTTEFWVGIARELLG